jgi:hypothetical protein
MKRLSSIPLSKATLVKSSTFYIEKITLGSYSK